MKVAVGLLSGLIFGLGLALSGMLDPARVLGFLDVAGRWDPSLAFVLAGAVTVSFAGYRCRSSWRGPHSPNDLMFLPASGLTPAWWAARRCSASAGIWRASVRVRRSPRWAFSVPAAFSSLPPC
jgi:hypothetical protein